MGADPAVAWRPDRSRYELTEDGALAGHADVELDGDTITFTHTHMRKAFQGQGLAHVLAEGALADAVARHLRIVPKCPFIAKYLRKHDVPGATVEWPDR